MKKQIVTWLLILSAVPTLWAQKSTGEVTGVVLDENKEPLIGVNIVIKDNPGLGTITDVDGKYHIKATSYQVLIFSYIGYDKMEIPINNRKKIDVQMNPSQSSVLDEVTITGTGIQKKATVTGAITSVDITTLANSGSAATSITNALAGNVAGVIGMQSSGEPGKVSEFWIRGISTFGANAKALVLVDGFERSMDELNIEDIESFSILKDASATAIYGSRGANGVVLITTKRGKEGKVNIDFKMEGGYNTRTRTPEFVDGYTYASLLNESLVTRNQEPRYTPTEMEILRLGMDKDLYPNVDWKNALLRDGAYSERATLNISGGGTTARYYVSVGYLNQEGMYKTDSSLKNDYNTNANLSRWTYRMNADLNVTHTTLLSVGIGGSLDLQNMPGMNNDQIWQSIVGQNPISIPFVYSDGKIPTYGTGNRTNPWVMATQTGYQETWNNKIQTNVTLEQKLDFVTKGLKFVGRYGFDTQNQNNNNKTKMPELWKAEKRRDENGNLVMQRVAEEQLMKQSSYADGYRNENLEVELHYGKLFGEKHDVGGTLKYFQYQKVKTADVGDDIMKAISRRSQGISGRVIYAFDSRYFAEFNFGYTGSENFVSGHQFGFFPAISGGWNIAEEHFIKDHWKWLDLLKLRYSYGEVGNDQLSNNEWDNRFPYLSSFGTMDGWDYGDANNSYYFDGYHYSQIASPNLGWEIAKKHNLGLDVSVFNGKFSLTVDVYQDTRDRIYMKRQYLSQLVGVTSQPWANVGKMRSNGVDGNFMYHEKFGQVDFTVRGNLTYTNNKVLEYDEQLNSYPYQMTEGFRNGQARGLIALGLFKDYEDIRNSPKQEFGDYMPGDIKYKDVNGDGVINSLDETPIGATRTPNLIYGLGVSASWKGFDFNIHFQGAGKSSYFINGSSVYAFTDGDWGNILTDMSKPGNRWISSEISGTVDTENPNAKYPRLSYGGSGNNYRNSTFWLRNGSYLRLKTVEIGYSLPQQWVRKMYMTKARFYLLGNNLAVFDSLKLWDPELASGDGMKYPLSKTYTLGLNVTF
jgi:TonB-linked SusC/RagA family outer membrane protein